MGIQEVAEQIITERMRAYDDILADMYYMAAQAGDRETQQEIWDEAWATNNLHLLVLLLLTETPFLS